ncbi:MAG TPA: DUF3368 domain-containing protein [Candidatus Hydrogenedentes bacterium]|nr:DUF3368 domain-containing protein [Candidatus Hydrogenedentota bacterium]
MIWPERLSVNRPPVINASPLILLSRASRLEILHHYAERVLVPESVADEIYKRGAADVTVKALSTEAWSELISTPIASNVVLGWRLGMGESSVLALAFSRPGTEAMIDNLAGGMCALAHRVPVRDTLGLVLAAKRRGHTLSARSVLQDLLQAGL